MKTNIKLQIEKLKVLDLLIEGIDIDNTERTRDMLLKLKENIDELLISDF